MDSFFLIFFNPTSLKTSKEAAILQAKTCLSTALEKPLNNFKLTNKLKRLKQPRFRLEIPVTDNSPLSLSELALEFFKTAAIKTKGSLFNVLIIWPNAVYKEAALKVYESFPKCPVEHADISSLSDSDARSLSFADLAVFFALETSQLEAMKNVSENLNPRAVVLFNPRWSFEKESEFGEMSSFVGEITLRIIELNNIIYKFKSKIFLKILCMNFVIEKFMKLI